MDNISPMPIAEVTPQTTVAPAVPVSAEPTPAPVKSEMQLHREKRDAQRRGETPVPAEPAAPIAATVVEPPTPAEPEAAPNVPKERVYDDEGTHYDLRTRAGRRIKALKGHLLATEQRNHELQLELARREVVKPAAEPARPAAPTGDAEPTLNQFDDQADPYAAYLAAHAKWHARQEFQRLDRERAERAQTQTRAQQLAEADQKYQAGLVEAKKTYPDFDTAQDALYTVLDQVKAEAGAQPGKGRHRYLVNHILTHQTPHALVQFLGTHPQELNALFAARSFDEHVRLIGELDAQVKAASKPITTVKPPTPPAAPIAPVGGIATVTGFDPKTANLAQWRREKQRRSA